MECLGSGAFHFLWLRGCGVTSPPLEEVGPSHVFEAASYGEQGVGARFRPAASRLFESAADDVLASAFHDDGSDRQSARPIEVATYPVRVGFVVADAGRGSFGPKAVRLQNGDQLLSDPVLARRPLALVRRHSVTAAAAQSRASSVPLILQTSILKFAFMALEAHYIMIPRVKSSLHAALRMRLRR